MFDFLTKKRYPQNMCKGKHGKKARILVPLPQNTTKKAHQKENWHCKGKREHVQTN